MNTMKVSFNETPSIRTISQTSPQRKEKEKVSVEEYIKDHYEDKKKEFAKKGIAYPTKIGEKMAISMNLRREYREKYLRH
jgi:hypothetical protein